MVNSPKEENLYEAKQFLNNVYVLGWGVGGPSVKERTTWSDSWAFVHRSGDVSEEARISRRRDSS